MKKLFPILAFLFLVVQVQAQQLPRVIILATGGTIAGAVKTAACADGGCRPGWLYGRENSY